MEFEIVSKLGKQLFEGFRKALRRFQPSKETGYFLMVFLNETINVHSTLPAFSLLYSAFVEILFLTLGEKKHKLCQPSRATVCSHKAKEDQTVYPLCSWEAFRQRYFLLINIWSASSAFP
jgi:hypothetical protein